MPDPERKLRLNQAIAKTGYCSRRQADTLIAEGRVAINGVACLDFSTPVDLSRDRLEINGKPLAFKSLTYVALHKPRGVVTTTSDEQDRETVLELLPDHLRHLNPVGRLDMYSEGLLLLTNDGDLAQHLTHPSHLLPKLYRVKVKGALTTNDLRLLQEGIPLEDGITQRAVVRLVERNKSYCLVDITLTEGRNRQIRRMFAYLGYQVVRLVRLAIGELQLGEIAPGNWRYLTSQEVSKLFLQSTD
jgi:23S rRNA pseudouridine2605 synthase